MPRVFLSYRRGDSAGYTGRIHDHLVSVLGDRQVFLDVADIPPGEDYLADLEKEIAAADAVLVVIGRQWLAGLDGARRIDDAADPVRWEILSAMRRNVRLLPLLVDGARMPAESDLPPPLRPFARREAVEVEHALFDECMARVLHAVGARSRSERSARRGWLWLGVAALVLTFGTRVAISLTPRFSSVQLGASETFFLLLFWALILALLRGALVLVGKVGR